MKQRERERDIKTRILVIQQEQNYRPSFRNRAELIANQVYLVAFIPLSEAAGEEEELAEGYKAMKEEQNNAGFTLELGFISAHVPDLLGSAFPELEDSWGLR